MAKASRRSTGDSRGSRQTSRKGEKGTEWLLKPPARDEINVYIGVGRDAKLSPKLRSALEEVARLLGGEAALPARPESSCEEVYIHTCVAHVDCKGVVW